MRVLMIGLDPSGLLPVDGHSRCWNRAMGHHVERLDVLVELNGTGGSGPVVIADNVVIHPVPVGSKWAYPFAALRYSLRIARQVGGYDLVTTEDPFRTGLAGLLFKLRTRTPLNVEYQNDHLFNAEWWWRRPAVHTAYHAIGLAVFLGADSARVLNHWTQRLLERLFGWRRRPIRVIPVCAAFYEPEMKEAARARRRALLRAPGNRLVLYLGRVVPVKRVDVLLRAFHRIAASREDVQLVIAGKGAELERLQAFQRRLAIPRVTWMGYVPPSEVHAYFGACDVFVNPAAVEPFGRVYLEALSARCPVVSTRNAGAVEAGLLVHEETALLIPPDDEPALAAAIQRLLDAPHLARRLAEEGERRVRRDYAYHEIARRVADLWRETARGARGFSGRASRGSSDCHATDGGNGDAHGA